MKRKCQLIQTTTVARRRRGVDTNCDWRWESPVALRNRRFARSGKHTPASSVKLHGISHCISGHACDTIGRVTNGPPQSNRKSAMGTNVDSLADPEAHLFFVSFHYGIHGTDSSLSRVLPSNSSWR